MGGDLWFALARSDTRTAHRVAVREGDFMRTPIHTLPARYQQQVAQQLDATPPFAVNAPEKPTMRQKRGGMNKTEAAFFDFLRNMPALSHIEREGVALKLGNGVAYHPDFTAWNTLDRVLEVFEVKGFMRDDAAVKLKTAAWAYPYFRVWLVRHVRGTWEMERVEA
jgi:hypothetical protein